MPQAAQDFEHEIRPRPELLARYEHMARHRGGIDIKADASVARRVASTVRRMAWLRALDDDYATVMAAMELLERRAEDLSDLAVWADAYRAHVSQVQNAHGAQA